MAAVIRRNLRLAYKFFGPYEVGEKVGNVAYMLAMNAGTHIRPIFHINLLKKRVGNKNTITTELPCLGCEGQFIVYPVQVLQRRTVKRNNAAVV